jgi:hypothetical protein
MKYTHKPTGLWLLIMVFLMLFSALPNVTLGSAGYQESPLFYDLQHMSAQELAAEMRFIIKAKQEGQYYPPERINAVEQALTKKQMEEMKNYQQRLTQEAEEAKKIEQLKEAALERAKEELGSQYEANEEQIQARAEEIVKETIGADNWDDAKNLYDRGSEYYEEKLSSYAEKVQKAYDYYNKYYEAKASNPEAPEAAQNLLGALAVTGDALKEIGEALGESPTPLKIVGQIMEAYGEACGLGSAAARNAWNYAHGGENSVHVTGGSIYQQDMENNNILDMERTPLQQHDKNLRIFNTGDNKYVAFDENGRLIPGPSGNLMTWEEYNKIQEAFTAWQSMKDPDWPNLTTAELLRLAAGEKINITLKDRTWPLADVSKEFSLEDILNKGSDVVKQNEFDTLIGEIDALTKDTRGFFDGWTQSGRSRDIRSAYYNYLEYIRATDPEWFKKSDVEQLGNFKEMIEKMLAEGKSWDDIKKHIQELKDQAASQKDKSTDSQNDAATNMLRNSLGLSSGQNGNPQTTNWIIRNGSEFSGQKDSGFTRIGNTNRPLPDPFALGIPVLKPNIYLYPTTLSLLKVSFPQAQNLTAAIPAYPADSGWQVQAAPNGRINGLYDFLFYEADIKRGFFQKNVAWSVRSARRGADLEKILDLYGFNDQEKADFIAFWTVKLDRNKDYLAYPQETFIINQAMPLNIEPQPQAMHRIWFYFAEKNGQEIPEPGSTEKIRRSGFTVVEWGGMVE